MEELKADPLLLERMKVDAYNEEQGSLAGCDCEVCKNKGFVAFLKDGLMTVRRCDCMDKRRSIRLMERSGIKPLLDMYRMDNYTTVKQWQKTAKKKAMDFANNGAGWFVISGNPGTGKTHLCTAICGLFLEQNKSVRYMVWREEAPKLKASVNDRIAYESLIGDFKQCDVLYIDDFWKGNVTEADINLSFELLNARYNDRSKLTILSGEKSVEQMMDIDEAIGSRIYERAKGNLIITPNENYRLQ